MRSKPSHQGQHLRPRRHERFFLWVESRAKRIVLVGIVLLVLESVYLGYAVLHERSDRQHQVNTAICSIIRAIPPGNVRIDEVRRSFKCGAFTPPSIPTRPTSTPSASKKPSPHPRASHKPKPKPSVIPPTRTIFEPGPTHTKKVTTTRTKPGPTKTITKRPRPSPSSSGILPDPICQILPGLCDLGVP